MMVPMGLTNSFCASMIIRVESEGEAVDGAAPVNSRNDFALCCSLKLERADVGIFWHDLVGQTKRDRADASEKFQ